MKAIDIYKAAYMAGMHMDPRGFDGVQDSLKTRRKNYELLTGNEKKYFDRETLVNAYADTRLNYDSGENVKGAIVGIDMEVGELLLADNLRKKGKNINLVWTHHPVGKSYANFYHVMEIQSGIFNSFGVTISAAETLVGKRMRDVGEKVAAANHFRAQDAAKLLDISMLSTHTAADNCVTTYLQEKFDTEKPKKVSDIMDILYDEPEYSEYAMRGVPPVILVGDGSRKVNRVFVDMTGGTEGPAEIYKKLSDKGVDTIVGMHFSAEHKKAIEEAQLNAVIAGHMSSDVLGMNILMDSVMEETGIFEIFETSGFIRFSRMRPKTKKKK
ncbi:MAG: Nif3-like dinuclear metal center hexameric protein [Spirochaetia bacterium]|nr:Nif3-like dinuclear metal center hexameric protein [Spirochaetia bacterium]